MLFMLSETLDVLKVKAVRVILLLAVQPVSYTHLTLPTT